MFIIDHPESFTEGVRVLSLVSRNKDKADAPNLSKVSYSSKEFFTILEEFKKKAVVGQRIYASLEQRDTDKAIREFKRRQLDADYDQDPLTFYKRLRNTWESCLMKPNTAKDKLWLIDCDSKKELRLAMDMLYECYDRGMRPYYYNTKTGVHIIVQPFNAKHEGKELIMKNPVMLWGF